MPEEIHGKRVAPVKTRHRKDTDCSLSADDLFDSVFTSQRQTTNARRQRVNKFHEAVRALAYKWIRIIYQCWRRKFKQIRSMTNQESNSAQCACCAARYRSVTLLLSNSFYKTEIDVKNRLTKNLRCLRWA